MFSKFVSRCKAIPARSADWANKAGPIAMIGCDYSIPGSGRAQIDALTHQSISKDADYYAELKLQTATNNSTDSAIECPPETVAFLPVLNCGNMSEVTPSSSSEVTPYSEKDWYSQTLQSVGDLSSKGYIPLTVGGNGEATLPAVEALKKIHHDEEVIVLHFSAKPCLSSLTDPIRVLQEKNLLKGVISIGNRCVSATDRKVRKEKKMFYLDMHAIFSKGLFCIRDLRNDFPIYLSIDVSVLDPSVAPGATRAESGGLSVRELLHIIHGIRAPKILGMDIHGFDPELDVYRGKNAQNGGLTTLATSKIIKESVLKAYSVSTSSQDEGLARVQMMQRQGSLSDSPYPEH